MKKQIVIEQTRNLFSDLYRLYFELQRESETEEIIVANGILCDKENEKIQHPVLTHRVKLDYDADENVVFIKDTEAPSELYSIVFQRLEDINLKGINMLSEELQRNDYHPLDRNDTPEFLKVLAHQLSSHSAFYESGVRTEWTDTGRFIIYLEPCYIVRKRLDGTLKAIEKIIENVKDTGEIPAPIIDIVSGGTVEISENTGEKSIEEQLAAVGGESVDILLAKEANKEQLEIARRIEHHNAVLVQGPPGTGKTHTIANLIGHFLAQGKTVLVTSQTTKALNVLKEKIAPGIQNLCVSVLDDSNIDMERSVDGITSRMSKTTSYEIRQDMNELALERSDIINKLADVRRKIFGIINQESNCIVYNGENISPSQAAFFVTKNADELSYIPGKIKLWAPIPLTFTELTELYRSNESISVDNEREMETQLPDPTQIMIPIDFIRIWKTLQTELNQIKMLASENNLIVENKIDERKLRIIGSSGEISLLYPRIEVIQDLKNYVSSFGKIEKWMKVVAVDGKNGGGFRQRWIILIEQIQKANDYAETIALEQFGLDIRFKDSDNMDMKKRVFETMRSVFAEKGKIGKLSMMIHKEYGIALDSVTINGKQVQSAQECEIVLHCIELNNIRKQCAIYWDELLSVHGVPKFWDLDTNNQERIARNWIPQIQKYLDWYEIEYQPLVNKLSAAGIPSDIIFGINTLDSDLAVTDKILSTIANYIPIICDICIAAIKIENCSLIINNTKTHLLLGKRENSHICNAFGNYNGG